MIDIKDLKVGGTYKTDSKEVFSGRWNDKFANIILKIVSIDDTDIYTKVLKAPKEFAYEKYLSDKGGAWSKRSQLPFTPYSLEPLTYKRILQLLAEQEK